ncbi:hypothetical protein AU252_06445 [Pseudarthrobacter sulfonivorans]|uniref:Metallo-beta-lactamase domain-containing protein n=1 Tax=Pseudarthrobacter sulfonivorans TaxID=121292 RepID=A0A0U3P6H8_9MICC|nr:MBL fold metallo-hydrolase [Pseudarthrobacter sulfonivorans]ALV40848.1 hypothetical protein AU252_06445 [Pseudarthrobacter sulfonivorans]
MIEIDFLPVENPDESSTRSGDAIAARFTPPGSSTPVVVVFDAGFTDIGDSLANHIEQHYNTTHIDYVVSTHPDADHINGLITLLDRCTVGELLMHLPWLHTSNAGELSNYEKIAELYLKAKKSGVTITEPFEGITRGGGALQILGPTVDLYRESLNEELSHYAEGNASFSSLFASAGPLATLKKTLERALALFPVETLTDTDDTSPRNQASVITLLDVDGRRHLLTGDAGIRGLNNAADAYENTYGALGASPLSFIQAPHHGSHHNVGPTVLDRLLGPKEQGFGAPTIFISSARLSEKHPSPRVTNAFGRRGGRVYVTEGKIIGHSHNAPARSGWSSATVLSPLVEDDA